MGARIAQSDDTNLFFGTILAQNIMTRKYKLWAPQVGFSVKEMGKSKVLRENLRIEEGLQYTASEPILIKLCFP